MATVSTIRLSVDLLDCAFVDSLDSRFLYRDSPYEIALTVLNGEAGLSTGIKLYDEDGEYLDLAGTATAADGTATITIDDEIDFDGAYTCLICVNGSKAAEFPLEVRAIGAPVPPTGTVLDWNVITSYTDTATHGPVRPGTGISNTVNADGSNTHAVAYGNSAGTAAQGNDARLSDSRTPTAHASTHATGGTDALTAANVGADPAGSAATVAGNLTAHIDDTTAAHAATAISNTPAGGIAATTVQAAINELDSEKLAVGGTAADVNPAGTAIAAALLAKANDNAVVKLTGDQVMSGKLTIQKTGEGTNLTLNRTDGARMQIGAGMAGNIICNGQYSFTWDGLAADVTPITLIHPTLAGNSVGQIRFRRFGSTAPHGDSTAAANRLLGFADSAEGQLKVVLEAVLNSLRAIGAGGLALQDSAGAEHALLTSTGLRIRPRVVSSSITAELDGVYHGTAAATYTDPTPAEGRGYLVRVVNGTQTVGSIGYAVSGTLVLRVYHSGAWLTRVLCSPSGTITESGTTRTIGRADVGQFVRLTNAGACTITVPANSTTAFEDGDTIYFRVTTVSPAALTLGSGVTVNNAAAITTLPQHSTFALRRTATTDVWDFV